MIAVKQSEVQANLEKYIDLAAEGEPVIIPRKRGGSVVVITESDFRSLQKAKQNAEYLAMLEESDRQLREGRIIRKTMDELEAMADE